MLAQVLLRKNFVLCLKLCSDHLLLLYNDTWSAKGERKIGALHLARVTDVTLWRVYLIVLRKPVYTSQCRKTAKFVYTEITTPQPRYRRETKIKAEARAINDSFIVNAHLQTTDEEKASSPRLHSLQESQNCL